MKKIMLFVSSMHSGGAERVTSILCNYWASQGHDVNLVATYSQRGDCHYNLHPKIKMEYLSDVANTISRGPYGKLTRLMMLRRMIISQEPDLVISCLTHVNIMVLLASLGTKTSVVVSEVTYPPSYPTPFLMRIARKYLYRTAKKVVIQTDEGLDWLNSEISNIQGVVISNPLSLPLEKTEPFVMPASIINEDQRIMLAVGRLDKAKGFDLLITAFQSVCEYVDDVQLVILGEGPLHENLQSLVNLSKYKDKVHLVGRVGNVQDWYDKSSLFVSTSKLEGFPNALLEAMGVGLPVVALDCKTGPRELISLIDGGLLLELETTPEALSRELVKLLRSRQDYAAKSLQAKYITDEFSVEKIAQQWLSLGEST